MNEALLARQGWRLIQNPQSYWARIIKGLYFPNCSFLEAKRGSRVSWAWLSLLQGREILYKGLRWQVQNGESIRFWEDRWVPSSPNFRISSPKPVECDIEEVKDVIDQVKGSWKKELLTKVVTQEEMQELLSIPISQVNRKDHLVWHYTKNGSYSVKSGYHQAVLASTTQGNGPSSSFTPNKKLWEVVWKLNIPHKVRHFWWRACSNSLATKENLMRRRCGSSKVCPICESFEESIEHTLFDCQWVRAVWFGCNLNLNVGHGHPSSVQKWTSQIVDDLKGEQLMGYLEKIVMIAWHIWKSRNDFVFNYNPVDPERT
ncbi:hypothetical protein RHMOL_Rhmol07G0245500 [Rhododendron molle]|uniref:Uncharacterized protein n=1 Tax=Rhododendron molle TaxID=49168 RepID=A0ACC0N6D7_RHOML|nr:hypothetical protein RHMOL_Rhmol07G0245500 [Rhododendron molle]